MLKTRVIPTLLMRGFQLVKGVSFDSWRTIGTVLPAIKVFNSRHVDELVLLDISATKESREPDFDSLEEYASECFVPLLYGGGISTMDHIRKALEAGADKICLSSAAFEKPGFIREASDRFGAQCIVVSIDARRNGEAYECFIHSGTKPTGKSPSQFSREIESLGAGEILLTSIERDGSLLGYDIPLIRSVTEVVSIPVIASGGCSGYPDMLAAVREGKASALAAGALFNFTESTPHEAKMYLKSNKVPVRIPRN